MTPLVCPVIPSPCETSNSACTLHHTHKRKYVLDQLESSTLHTHYSCYYVACLFDIFCSWLDVQTDVHILEKRVAMSAFEQDVAKPCFSSTIPRKKNSSPIVLLLKMTSLPAYDKAEDIVES